MLGTVWEKSVLDSTAYVNSVVGTYGVKSFLLTVWVKSLLGTVSEKSKIDMGKS